MKTILDILADLHTRLEQYALATVIHHNGSVPRSAGAKMVVLGNGKSIGTVGGGILEAQVEQLAGEVFLSRIPVIKQFQFNGIDASTMDAICGGQVDVLVEWVDPKDSTWLQIYEALETAVNRHERGWFLTALPSEIKNHNQVTKPGMLRHAFVQTGGSVVGTFEHGVEIEKISQMVQPDVICIDNQEWMVDPIETGGTVYIFGAGHVGRSLAPFTCAVGFRTVVLDDRPEYANPKNIPPAHETIVLGSYENVFANLPIDLHSFIVIVTRGHLNDRAVLTQALQTNAGYIGMIGSRRKCSLVLDELRKSGMNDMDIQRIHAPIGLPIQAETPEEIGVSITAEMIRVRAGLLGMPKSDKVG